MNVLPIITRELVIGARRPATYRQRLLLTALTAGIAGLILVFSGGGWNPTSTSRTLFITVAALGFSYALLSGVFLTSDTICTEREEGTLPLLFLTRLSGLDVVLGKLVSSSIVAGYALLGIMPVLALPALIGGISGRELFRVCLTLVSTLVFSLSLGMACSARARGNGRAMAATLGWAMCASVGLYLGAAIMRGISEDQAARWLMMPSPLGALMASFDGQKMAAPYWASILSLWLLSSWMLVMAGRWTRHQLTPLPPDAVESVEPFARANAALSATPTARLHPPLEVDPCLWLFGRRPFPTNAFEALWPMWAVGFGALWLLAFGGSFGMGVGLGLGCFTAFGFHTLTKWFAAVHASRLFAEHRRSGALEVLLTTPVKPEEVIQAALQAVRQQLRPVVVTGVMMNGMILLAVAVTTARAGYEANGAILPAILLCLGGALLLPMDCRAMALLTARHVLAGRHETIAVLRASVQVLVAGWLVSFCFLLICAPAGLAGLWIVLYLLLCLGFGIALTTVCENGARDLSASLRRMLSDDHTPNLEVHLTPAALAPAAPAHQTP